MTYIEIRGTDFINKGAELMLIAALDRLGQQVEGAKFVMAPSQMSPYEKSIGLMLYQKIQFKILGYQISRFGHLIPKKFQKYYGLVHSLKSIIYLMHLVSHIQTNGGVSLSTICSKCCLVCNETKQSLFFYRKPLALLIVGTQG